MNRCGVRGGLDVGLVASCVSRFTLVGCGKGIIVVQGTGCRYLRGFSAGLWPGNWIDWVDGQGRSIAEGHCDIRWLWHSANSQVSVIDGYLGWEGTAKQLRKLATEVVKWVIGKLCQKALWSGQQLRIRVVLFRTMWGLHLRCRQSLPAGGDPT